MNDLFGLDLAGQRPKLLTGYLDEEFDYLITVFPGPEQIHWSSQNPATVEGDAETRRRAFDQAARDMASRIRLWMSLPAVAARVAAARTR